MKDSDKSSAEDLSLLFTLEDTTVLVDMDRTKKITVLVCGKWIAPGTTVCPHCKEIIWEE